ncbi:hypothetical protein SO802_000468 [Lithocarpus litseifolius]|uniref:RING-type domain-containing protein n=1 Tax=Lithocarpus litseifolius TaxID=425828 RepID=A0AAW2DTD2_9ROSI
MPPLQQTQAHGSPPKPNPRVLSLLLKAIIMALLTSLFFLFLGLASAALLLLHLSLSHHRHRHRRGSSLSLATAAPSSGLSPTVLDALPRFRLKRTQPHRRNNGSGSDVVLGGDDDCVVCLDAFKDAQWCRKLSACGHVFHMRCVDSWLAKVAACPICRAPVRSNAAMTGSSVVSLEEEEKNFWVFGRGC